jgi:hypothetical protein
VQGEVDRARQAMTSPRAAGEYAGSMVDPLRLASALRRGPMQELDVYHGTPHKYASTEANPLGEFDASKIGTGEGAQAYGHGIYYAENIDVAKGYQPRDTKTEEKLMRLYKQAEARQDYDSMDVLESAMLHKTAGELREMYPQNNKLIDQIGKITAQSKSSLYKADLPDEMIDRMLDWDKPLSEQSAAVKKALKDSGIWKKYKENLSDFSSPKDTRNKNMRGENIQAFIEYLSGGDKAKASQMLREIGIPGIRYLDAGSRGKVGTGTRNFVVFPGEEKKVKILRRE